MSIADGVVAAVVVGGVELQALANKLKTKRVREVGDGMGLLRRL